VGSVDTRARLSSSPMPASRRVALAARATAADLAQLGGLFQDLGLDPPAPQRQRQREAAHPGADDHD
jgi:hypothetical protein